MRRFIIPSFGVFETTTGVDSRGNRTDYSGYAIAIRWLSFVVVWTFARRVKP